MDVCSYVYRSRTSWRQRIRQEQSRPQPQRLPVEDEDDECIWTPTLPALPRPPQPEAPPAPAPGPSTDELMKDAKAAMDAGDMVSAHRLAEKVIESVHGPQGETYEGLLRDASEAASRGDLYTAKEAIAKALEHKDMGNSPTAYMMHGALCLQQGEWLPAKKSLAKAYKRAPGDWQINTNLASACLHLGKYDLAVQHAGKACQLQPRVAAARLILIQALRGMATESEESEKKGVLTAALNAGKEALRIYASKEPQPAGANSEPPMCAVGEVLVDLGELDEAWSLAVQAADAAGQSGPLMGNACILAGRVQEAAGQYEKALDAYQKATMQQSSGSHERATALRTNLITKALRHALPAVEGDVFITTYPKSGTTWMQQVVCMLSGEPADVDIQMRAPYIEAAIATSIFSLERLRKLKPPRLFKTHAGWEDLPVAGCTDNAPPRHAKVVVVVRDPRDVMVSLYFHSKSIKGISYEGSWDEWFSDFLNGRAPLPMQASADLNGKAKKGGRGSKSDWFSHTLGWWRVAQANPSQVLWVRYEEMLAEPLQSVRKVARLVAPEKADDEALLERIVQASSFSEMKQRHESDANAEMRNAGGTSHFRKGKSGDWRSHLSEAQSARFSKYMADRLKGSGLEDAFLP